jgi:hypothetical protein
MDEYQLELEHALQARSIGNEGMSRVCARRAAGIVIGEYLLDHGYTHLTHSVYERILQFCGLPNLDPELKTIASHFLVRVDNNHHIPAGIDLIEDVRKLYKVITPDLDD